MDSRDESRLNDWIEGVASAEDAAAVEAMLARDPVLSARVRAMRSDRAVLGSIPAPTLPAELRAAIDDRVARMLLLAESTGDRRELIGIETDAFPFTAENVPVAAPGGDTADWRARRQSRLLARRWTIGAGAGLAAAAAVTLLVLLQTGAPSPGAGDDADQLAAAGSSNASGDAAGGNRSGPSAPPFRPTEQAVVMHGLPLPTVAPAPLRMAQTTPGGDGDAGAASVARAVDAPVPAIRFAGLDRATLEARLIALAGSASPSGGLAVTRNLTTATLARMVPRTAPRSSEPLWADLEQGRRGDQGGGWLARVDERVDRVVGDRGDGSDAARDGRVIAGEPARRPGWGEQIVFAESGASWTLSVPAAAAADVLARLEESLGGQARSGLVTLDPVAWRVGDGTAAWRVARSELRRLAIEDPERLVHIPIVLAGD